MLRLVLSAAQSVRHMPMPAAEAVLGAAADADIVLAARGVSRRHLRLLPSDGSVELVDLGSKNGIVVEGIRHRRWRLQPGDHVRLGTAWLSLEEVSTRDCDMGVQWEATGETAAGSTEVPGESTRDLGTGAAAALRLVRELLCSPSRDVIADASFLEQARTVLRASGLFLVAGGGEAPVALAAVAGSPPSAGLLERAGQLPPAGDAAHQPWVLCMSENGWLATAAARLGADPLRLAAWWDQDAEPAAWQREMLLCLASSVADRPAIERSSCAAAGVTGLRFPPPTVLGNSPALQRLLSRIEMTIDSGLDVLLTGETGVGKELFVRMIHLSGGTADRPFIPVNCPGIPEELQEAEFFGIERNVATGVDRRPGYFQLAHGGTLFLDEIGDMPLILQGKLLRAIQEREFLPVGGRQAQRVDLRVVASTNRDLAVAVEQGRFRADLYYRLRQLHYEIPPLRERRQEIPALALAFAREAAAERGRPLRGISRKALELLMAYNWPGNVRELRYTLGNAVALAPADGVIESRHLERHLLPGEPPAAGRATIVAATTGNGGRPDVGPPSARPTTADPGRHRLPTVVLHDLERLAIVQALDDHHGNKSRAARQLGVSRAGLYRKMQRHGIAG